MIGTTNVKEYRKPQHEIEDLFIERWSPRSMSGEKIEKKELMKLFEAARWAPSAYNSQPWKFIYVTPDSEKWDDFFSCLIEFNQQWVKNAGTLMILASRKNFEHNNKPSPTHSFDTGSAWQNLALQGSKLGLVVHGMSGIDFEKAKQVAELDENHEVMAMAAVGKPDSKEKLPESMQDKEFPSDRKKIEEFVFENKLNGGEQNDE
jgi:nitroreductase